MTLAGGTRATRYTRGVGVCLDSTDGDSEEGRKKKDKALSSVRDDAGLAVGIFPPSLLVVP